DNLIVAIDLLENYQGAQRLNGDIIFEGDLDGWTRFARLLLLKALVRVGSRQPVQDLFDEHFNFAEILGQNEQNATFNFTAGPPNNYPLTTARIGIFNVFLMSETAAEIFEELDDPRVSRLYRPAANTGEFTGIINGIDAASSIVPDNFARPGTIFREDGSQFQFHYGTAWEYYFLLAEAGARGLVNLRPDVPYELAVRLAFEYWGVEMPRDYLRTGPAAWDDERGLEQIMTQKWMANIGNAYEAWADWRRTGYPNLKPVAASLNGGQYPVRMPYPNDEQALNFENYQTAAAATEGNSINVRVWWDVD
ncbi:MAG: SusD/RagB family nutrient-binding outer membrane lipoprotein, partial [Bacteroidota bacterium]